MARSELTLRVLFAAAAIPIVIVVAWYGDWPLAALLAIAAALAASEFFALARAAGHRPLAGLGVVVAAILPLVMQARTLALSRPTITVGAIGLIVICSIAVFVRPPNDAPVGATAITIFGVLYTGALLSFGYALRYHEYVLGTIDRRAGAAVLLFPVLLTWTSDTGAYFVGRLVGRHKLAPRVSPGKTIEGAVGGLIFSIIVAVLYVRGVLVPYAHLAMLPSGAALFGAVVSAASQIGDLFESLIKRESGTKDSSRLIPGHGGVLDRLDSLLFALPVAYWMLGIVRVFPVPT